MVEATQNRCQHDECMACKDARCTEGYTLVGNYDNYTCIKENKKDE